MDDIYRMLVGWLDLGVFGGKKERVLLGRVG